MKYVLDKIATAYRIRVLHLPPYYYDLNPIELIWSQIKNGVAQKNTTLKLQDVKLLEKINLIAAEDGRKCIMLDLDTTVDVLIDWLLLTLEDNSSVSDEDNTFI